MKWQDFLTKVVWRNAYIDYRLTDERLTFMLFGGRAITIFNMRETTTNCIVSWPVTRLAVIYEIEREGFMIEGVSFDDVFAYF